MGYERLQEIYNDDQGKWALSTLLSALRTGNWKEDKIEVGITALHATGYLIFRFAPRSQISGSATSLDPQDQELFGLCQDCINAIDGVDQPSVSQGPLSSIVVQILFNKLQAMIIEWFNELD